MVFTLRSFLLQILPVAVTILLLTISMILLNISTTSPEQSSGINDWLVALNLGTLAVLFFLIIGNLIRALQQLRSKKAGSRYTMRLMSAFAVLTIFPVLIVSYFSMNFLGDRIDSWYNVKIEDSLADSLELAERSLKIGTSLHLRDIELLARELFRVDEYEYSWLLENKRQDLNAYEILMLDSQKRVVAYSSLDSTRLFHNLPHESLFTELASNGFAFSLEPDGENGLYARVSVTMQRDAGSERYVLTALFPVSQKFAELSDSVQHARDQYLALKLQRKDIKQAFRLSLFIVMVLSVLFALWAAFAYSQRLTGPIRKLFDGTLAVASGDLQKKIPVTENDDFSLLARSFNTMTSRLSQAQRESENSRIQVQRQHDYLNVVLNHLTSGVLTIDENLQVRRLNMAGQNLLELEEKVVDNRNLLSLADESDTAHAFIEKVLPYLQGGNSEWKTEIMLLRENKRKMFVCQGATLPQLINGSKGSVMVFDDITDLIQAEHDAAWSEVARRLAHEIKNPLTPIQLSAERLQHRLMPELSEKSSELLKRMIGTITHQVETMKGMVNEFSEYARTPSLQLQSTQLNKLIGDVAELYHANEQKVSILLDLGPLPMLALDVHRMRQVFINLFKNALEALELAEGEKVLRVSTRHSEHDEVVIVIEDNGHGIDEKLLPQLFEPYVSSKAKGTGLGLAIVKKIIEEHSGSISVKNGAQSGAVFTILLPVTSGKSTN